MGYAPEEYQSKNVLTRGNVGASYSYGIDNRIEPMLKISPLTMLLIRLFSSPVPLVSGPLAGAFRDVVSLVTSRETEFRAPLLLEAASAMPCFVISVIGQGKASLLSALSGLEFMDAKQKPLTIGVNYMPRQTSDSRVVSLINVVALLYAAGDPFSQAIAFISAVSASSTVIVDVADLPGFWRWVTFCCDVICHRLSVAFQSNPINVVFLGDELRLDIADVPRTSTLHALAQACSFHFVSREDPITAMAECLNAKSNTRQTSDMVPLLRKATAVYGAHFDRRGGLVRAEDLFHLSDSFRMCSDVAMAQWLCKLSADLGHCDAQFALATQYEFAKERYLQLAADNGHPMAQWELFLADPSRVNYLNTLASAGHPEAVFKIATTDTGAQSVIPWLLRFQIRGVERASHRLFDIIDYLSPRVAFDQARYWVSRDSSNSFVCYRAAQRHVGHIFPLYRSILLACNRDYSEPADHAEDSLRSELGRGNKSAAVHLAKLISDGEEKVRVLEQGVPAVSALFALMEIYSEDATANADRIYEFARDTILATPYPTDKSQKAQDQLIRLLQQEDLSDIIQKRAEVAELMLDESNNSFNHDPRVVASFLDGYCRDTAEILVIRAKMATTQGERDSLLREAGHKADPRNIPLRAEIECLSRLRGPYHGLAMERRRFVFDKLGSREIPTSSMVIFEYCIREVVSDDSDIWQQFLRSLVLAIGAFGITKDRETADEIWRVIDVHGLEGFPMLGDPALRQAQADFLRFKVESAQNDEDEAIALCLLADNVQSDRDMAVLLLKRVFLLPPARFNAVKKLPKYLPLFLKLLNDGREDDLSGKVLRRIDSEWPGNENPELLREVSRYPRFSHYY
jgi:TPR repeat protein